MKNLSEKNMKKQQQSEMIYQQKYIKTSAYIPGEKNGKWSQQQHMMYIAFIDFYKQKMRSKQKRRSNQFYKQMSDFIGTRNGLQCRSHHQKLEEKYIYTNKIIGAFKQKFDVEAYKKCISQLKNIKMTKLSSNQARFVEESHILQNSQKKDAGVQTDLQGISFNYIVMENSTILIYPTLQGVTFNNGTIFYPTNYIYSSN